jgi:hypothetical protein
MALSGFAPSGSVFLSAAPTSSQVALPVSDSPPTALVTNTGDQVAYVELGTSSAVVAAIQTSMAVLPGQSVALTLGANTNLAAITLSRQVGLNITTGT